MVLATPGDSPNFSDTASLHKPASLLFFLFFCAFVFFSATPTAYGSSQARGQIGALVAGLRHSHSNTRSATYTTAHGHAGSLTH